MWMEKYPELGSKPVRLTIKMPTKASERMDTLPEGLRELYRRGELADVSLVCARQAFLAHRVVLAAQSEVFRQGLATGELVKQEVRLAEISNPEAVKFMLDYMYQMDVAVWEDYNPRTQEINKDILRLAHNFKLPGLVERATIWLAKDLTTGNVVERLTICEDFGLAELREKIIAELTENKDALTEVASSPLLTLFPTLMQALLQHVAASAEAAVPHTSSSRDICTEPRPKKKARRT